MKKNKSTAGNLNHKIKELEENWKRALADYRNLEKRINQQQENFVRLANLSLVDKLLGVLDDFERALEHNQDKGIRLIYEQFREVLQTEGVKELEIKGQNFDPETMDCVEMVPGNKNQVINVQLKGYKLNNRVIRPAKVEVGSGMKK